MSCTTPKRKSGFPTSASSGILSSNRKSKIQTPQRRVSRLTSFSSSKKKSDIIERCSSTPINPTLEAAKRSLDESSYFLPEKKKVVSDATDGRGHMARRQSSKVALASSTSPRRQSSNIALASSTSPRRPSSNIALTSSTSTIPSENEEAVRVGVRIRPLLEKDDEPRSFLLGPAENTIVRNGSDANAYQFNHVYGETSSTQQLYDDMVSDIVESVGCQGRNGTVFTYGQTSTGKTYTMHGLLMAAGKDLFGMIQGGDAGFQEHDLTPTSLTSVRISCMELYNEELRDLLCTSTSSLSIQEDRRGNVLIPNLSERTVGNIQELMGVIQIAEDHRTVGSTAMNEKSSRSHTIFRITYVKREATSVGNSGDESDEEDKENDGMCISKSSQTSSQKVVTTVSTLNLVDLAGSESVRVTGAKGERQKEGGKINQSLLTLSRVLSKLGKKNRGHINYRDSKLTRILKPSLSGNARMGCICCISPDVNYSEESKSTLDFASRTMLVTTNAKSNQTVEYDDALVEEFEREIERVKMETKKAEEGRRQMEQSLQDAEDKIVCLRASVELEKSKVSSLERQKKEHLAQVEENKTVMADQSQKEICDLKAQNGKLEADMLQYEAEKNKLKEQLQHGHDLFYQERIVMDSEQAILIEEHKVKLECMKKEVISYKEQKECMDALCAEMQSKLESTCEELQASKASKSDSTDLDGTVAELEIKNTVLSHELVAAKSNDQKSQDEIAALKSEVAALTQKSSYLEFQLERELIKKRQRNDKAKEKRQKFKGRLSGMRESLKDDIVDMTYEKDF